VAKRYKNTNNISLAVIIRCTHNQKSDQSDLLKFVHNQIQICSDACEKNLTSWQDFCKPCPWRMRHKHSNSQFQMANHRDWGNMGYNDVTVCVTVINLMNAFFFVGLDRSCLTNLIDRSVDYECNHYCYQYHSYCITIITNIIQYIIICYFYCFKQN